MPAQKPPAETRDRNQARCRLDKSAAVGLPVRLFLFRTVDGDFGFDDQRITAAFALPKLQVVQAMMWFFMM